MANREFLMLGHTLTAAVSVRKKMEISNWMVSAKLDGMRAIWIPCTAGVPVEKVPFANRARDAREHVATGLWSRYAKVIHAPKWFTSALPNDVCLDGELWSGRGTFNDTMSAVKKLEPVDKEWERVRFMVFDSPHYDQVYVDGDIGLNRKVSNYKMRFSGFERPAQPGSTIRRYEDVYYELARRIKDDNVPHLRIVEQQRVVSWDEVERAMEGEISMGGEGIMLRMIGSSWCPRRSHYLLKYKPYSDAEGVIVSWEPGKGRLEGMLGSLRVRMDNGKEFDLSGFTDSERVLIGDERVACFNNGEKVVYKYRELTPDGLPKEARYFRKHLTGEAT